MRRAVLVAVTVVGCGSSKLLPSTSDATLSADSPTAAADALEADSSWGGCDGRRLIFLEHRDDTYFQGAEDATQNTMALIGLPSNPFNVYGAKVPPATWDQVGMCVSQSLAAFDTHVVVQDPGMLPHIEVNMIDMHRSWGCGECAGAVFTEPPCGTTFASPIVLVGGSYNDTTYSVDAICDRIVQAIGREYHLSYLTDPQSVMGAFSYGAVYPRAFIDATLACYRNPCDGCARKNVTAENSYTKLLDALGACTP